MRCASLLPFEDVEGRQYQLPNFEGEESTIRAIARHAAQQAGVIFVGLQETHTPGEFWPMFNLPGGSSFVQPEGETVEQARDRVRASFAAMPKYELKPVLPDGEPSLSVLTPTKNPSRFATSFSESVVKGHNEPTTGIDPAAGRETL